MWIKVNARNFVGITSQDSQKAKVKGKKQKEGDKGIKKSGLTELQVGASWGTRHMKIVQKISTYLIEWQIRTNLIEWQYPCQKNLK